MGEVSSQTLLIITACIFVFIEIVMVFLMVYRWIRRRGVHNTRNKAVAMAHKRYRATSICEPSLPPIYEQPEVDTDSLMAKEEQERARKASIAAAKQLALRRAKIRTQSNSSNSSTLSERSVKMERNHVAKAKPGLRGQKPKVRKKPIRRMPSHVGLGLLAPAPRLTLSL